MQTIIMLAPWGTGSSAITGYFTHCGAYSCPPYFRIPDERTNNTFEPKFYRRILVDLFDEHTLTVTGNMKKFDFFFDQWRDKQLENAKINGQDTVVIKHALSCLLIPYLKIKINPKFILITRPIDEVEKTRIRRTAHPIFGQLGAKKLYNTALNDLIKKSIEFQVIPFNEFKRSSDFRLRTISASGLKPSKDQIESAELYLRK